MTTFLPATWAETPVTWVSAVAGPPLVDERGPDPEVVGQRLDPLGPAGVGAGQDEVVAAEPARRRDDDRLAVDVDRPDAALEVVGDRGDVEVEEEDLVAARAAGIDDSSRARVLAVTISPGRTARSIVE